MEENNGRMDIKEWRQQLFNSVIRIEEKLDKYGRRIASNKTQIIIQWFVLGAVLVAIFVK
jgi:hypothetical protein